MYMMGWRGSLSRKRCQGTSVRRHVEINCRINPLTSIDKLAETSWRIIKSIDRDEEEKIRGEWSRIHS
jgi:hypothetical protein